MTSPITGRRVAVVLMAEASGVSEKVTHGTVVETSDGLSIEHGQGVLKLSNKWARMIGPLEPAASRARLGADYALPLVTDRLSPGELASLISGGLQLPSSGHGGTAQ